MDRRDFLVTSTALLSMSTLPLLTRCQDRGKRKPNVVLIMTDDQGYGDMHCHGHPRLKTPNLDKLHAQSIRFTNFHVDPYCAPTRAALMTGRYALRTGVWHTYGGRNWLFEDETLMPEIFKMNGYTTGHFGKWHLGDNYPFAAHFRGFDVSFTLGSCGLGATDDYWGNDRFDDTYFLNGEPVKTTGFGTDNFVDHCLKFIEENRDKPFFVYLAPNIVHRPWNIPYEYRLRYDPEQIKSSEIVAYSSSDMARFYGTIDKIDEQVGRVIDYLDREQLADDTILLFLTDNGTVSSEYNAGMRGRKGSPYEGGHRVPLFIRWPNGGLRQGMDISDLTAHIDLLPTLMDLCDLKVDREPVFDGKNLAPLLQDDVVQWANERAYITQMAQNVPGYHITPPKWGLSAVLTQQWRLVNKNELYDIQKDPGQEHDISAQNPEVVKQLQEMYEAYWADILPRTKHLARVIIGHPEQATTVLSLTNLTPVAGGNAVWSQISAATWDEIEGIWPLKVQKAGMYAFELRRWPRELDLPINAFEDIEKTNLWPEFKSGSTQINPVQAGLSIGDTTISEKINADEKAVEITVELTEGDVDLKTWFADKNGTSRSAYWVYIRPMT